MEKAVIKVAVLPLDIAWGDIDENIVTTADALRHIAEGTDLVVVPEMFSTGFITEPTLLVTYTEERTEHTFEVLRRWAAHFGFAIAGSMIARVGSALYNRGFLVEPSGETTTYDKRHLFSLGGEARTYTPGRGDSPIIRYRGCNIKLLVCYDLRFPVWARNRDCEYDLLIYPANWPDSRAMAWHHLLIARAIENQAYVIGCNRTGADDFGEYGPGRSRIFNHWGDDITTNDPAGTPPPRKRPGTPVLPAHTEAPANPYGIVYGQIDMDLLATDRRRFPVYRDADTFTI